MEAFPLLHIAHALDRAAEAFRDDALDVHDADASRLEESAHRAETLAAALDHASAVSLDAAPKGAVATLLVQTDAPLTAAALRDELGAFQRRHSLPVQCAEESLLLCAAQPQLQPQAAWLRRFCRRWDALQ